MNNFSKNQKIFFLAIIIIVLLILGYYVYGRNTETFNETNEEEIMIKTEDKKENDDEKIVVHISGAIKNEGIVELEKNSRVADAIEVAGGLTEDADMSKINLAYILEDGVKIKIPSHNDKVDDTEVVELVENIPESSTKSENSADKPVNINKASQAELETLPGIGPSTALKIINYREENGKFSNIEDLKNISGIGDSKFENIKNLICIK